MEIIIVGISIYTFYLCIMLFKATKLNKDEITIIFRRYKVENKLDKGNIIKLIGINICLSLVFIIIVYFEFVIAALGIASLSVVINSRFQSSNKIILKEK